MEIHQKNNDKSQNILEHNLLTWLSDQDYAASMYTI